MDVDEPSGMELAEMDDDGEEAPGDSGAEATNGLECDFSAYVLFHEGNVGAPCLSFDILEDELGDARTCETPVTCYFVAGTQAARTHVNNVMLIKMSNLRKVKQDEESDEESDDGDEDEATGEDKDKPTVAAATLRHSGSINRIRATTVNKVPLAASWSELGAVHIWDLSSAMDAVDEPRNLTSFNNNSAHSKPLFTFTGHTSEGFALDWSPVMPGTLLTGDCSRNIHLWKPGEGGTWGVEEQPYSAHTASVEDIQWSPNEQHVFASCSVDKSIRIWDARAQHSKACMLTAANAHKSDVNVIHWNRNEPFIASGGDDAIVKVWDLRQFQSGEPVAVLAYHNSEVTTVEWHATDSSVLASGGSDDQLLQWDLAVERDPDAENAEEDKDTPAQLLFVHKGQQDVKELHWHRQIPGLVLSTAHSGFNIFKTISS